MYIPIEYQRSIVDWANNTFGDNRNIQGVLDRTNVEMQELTNKIIAIAPVKDVVSEMADVVIMLYTLADMFECELIQEVDIKMVINRNREWDVDKETGLGQHKETS